jgi:aryl-alcohol dehydrogenase-like predicted oxidoreductase
MQVALGTVQFGLAYGIAGNSAPMTDRDARATLEIAFANGIRVLDTAAAYGDAETRLGRLIDGLEFRVVSKIPALPTGESSAAFIASSLERTRHRLGETLRAIMFHRAADLSGPTAEDTWNVAERAIAGSGIKLGVSCYDPLELSTLQRYLPIELAQVPGSAFDQRFAAAIQSGAILLPVELHMRSAFLQGLLLMSLGDVTARLPIALNRLTAWKRWCAERALTPLQGALAIAKATPSVDYLVLGVDGPAHLEEIMREWHRVDAIAAPELACEDPSIIDPRQWKSA